MLRQALKLKHRFCNYASKMHEAWRVNPKAVHPDWDSYFKSAVVETNTKSKDPKVIDEETMLALSAYLLISYYKNRGHQLAELDPLRLENFSEFGKIYISHRLDSDLKRHNILKDAILKKPFSFPHSKLFTNNICGFLSEQQQWTLEEIKKRLEKIYSGKIGIEFMHIFSLAEKSWLMHRFERLQKLQVSTEEKLNNLAELTKIEAFNSFLNDKLKTSKRFGVEGLDSMVLGLNELVKAAVRSKVEYIGFGMAHRGRLNALANVFNKPMQVIFAEFQEAQHESEEWGNSGDVKYHLGATVIRKIQGRDIRLSIMPNPSHLEAVNPVVMGHVKAVGETMTSPNNAMTVLIHGDAALAGQGIVYQCLQMGYLENCMNNGVIHVVANNQIGFTTTPAEARTGLYCTDIAKSIQAPIIHVNADEPQLVNEAIRIAFEYRQLFHKDIFIDIIGYRKYGHNEQDQPAFTQPMMYQVIGKRKNIYTLYKEKLIQEGCINQQAAKEKWDKQISIINSAYADSSKQAFNISKWKTKTYHSVVDFSQLGEIKNTGLPKDVLKEIGSQVVNVPETFNINPQIRKIYQARRIAIDSGQGIDFGTAQSLAFGSLLKEGFNVRLTGQDAERGTFSHRHMALVDQKTQEKYIPLHNLLNPNEKPRMQVSNSFLSQYAALGFEYGYSITNPNALTIWEAQFGDFANGAQIIIDNYLTSGESKWNVQSGLVMNLPHGMDGQGPEHSSARMERYLQLMNDGWTSLSSEFIDSQQFKPIKKSNFQVICCSNAGSLFHAYRRQLRRDYRKPLINFVSKKLLKMKEAATNYEFLAKERFETILQEEDPSIDPKKVTKVVTLCGQAYYSALERRKQLNRKDVALVRLEQIAPFHYKRYKKVIEKYPNAKEFVWFQEQHKNSGAWGYVAPRISFILEELKKEGKISTSTLNCVSRRVSASTAVGKKKKHDEEQAQILAQLYSS